MKGECRRVEKERKRKSTPMRCACEKAQIVIRVTLKGFEIVGRE